METRQEIFNTVLEEIKKSLPNIKGVKEYSNPAMAHVAITLKEDVTVDDMMTVAKIAYDRHDEMQLIEIKSRYLSEDKSESVSNVIEVALPLVTE